MTGILLGLGCGLKLLEEDAASYCELLLARHS